MYETNSISYSEFEMLEYFLTQLTPPELQRMMFPIIYRINVEKDRLLPAESYSAFPENVEYLIPDLDISIKSTECEFWEFDCDESPEFSDFFVRGWRKRLDDNFGQKTSTRKA